jgi:hypothetical protein
MCMQTLSTLSNSTSKPDKREKGLSEYNRGDELPSMELSQWNSTVLLMYANKNSKNE